MVRQYVHQTGEAHDRFLVFEDSRGDNLRCIVEAPRGFERPKMGKMWFRAEFRGKTEFIA